MSLVSVPHGLDRSIPDWLTTLQQDILAQSWPYYTPILLTLLDSAETELKTRALRIFGAFWARCPPGLMDRVGLTSVFADAVFPAVLYLPSLTPEDESLLLLNAAYPALAQLAGLSRAPPPSLLHDQPADQKEAERVVTTPDLTAPQRRLLDKIVREGVVAGHFHARDYPRLTTLFCEELHILVGGMGILATKYLKVCHLPPPQNTFPICVHTGLPNATSAMHMQNNATSTALQNAVAPCHSINASDTRYADADHNVPTGPDAHDIRHSHRPLRH